MLNPSARDASAREQLSALADGELESSAVAAACMAWKDEADARATWHSYQLIGDVLRSDDLAAHAAHDSAFMQSLRARLAAEPVVLAPVAAPDMAWPVPQHVNNARSRRWGWAAPSAVAAGFVAVAGALFVTRAPVPGVPLAVNNAAPAASAFVAAPRGNEGAVAVSNPALVIRDPQLDRYLAAHKQFAGSSALVGMPSGFLRNAVAEVPAR